MDVGTVLLFLWMNGEIEKAPSPIKVHFKENALVSKHKENAFIYRSTGLALCLLNLFQYSLN
jgi:hypothetical protein